jgi:hypothetical protein
VQNQLLDQFPSTNLRVYAVWLPMLWTDRRNSWNGTNMPDPRVVHFWDGEREVGQWFAEHVDGYEGVAWNVYYLYRSDAVWERVPSSLADSGGTIIAEYETLERHVQRLLGE